MNALYIDTKSELENLLPGFDLSSYSDATISGMVNLGSRWVDSITNASNGWEYETITNEEYSSKYNAHTDANGNLIISLLKRPLLDVNDVTDVSIHVGAFKTSLTLKSGTTPVISAPEPMWSITYPNTWLVSTGTLLSNQRLFNLRSFDYHVLVSYSAGYKTIPYDIKYATALSVANQMSKQFNQAGASSVHQGNISMSFGKGKPNDESPFLSEAKTYLRNYVRTF